MTNVNIENIMNCIYHSKIMECLSMEIDVFLFFSDGKVAAPTNRANCPC